MVTSRLKKWNSKRFYSSLNTSFYPCPQKLPVCALCGIQGHIQRDCPGRHCPSCGLPSHCHRPCQEPPMWSQHCQRCRMTGHLSDVSLPIGHQGVSPERRLRKAGFTVKSLTSGNIWFRFKPFPKYHSELTWLDLICWAHIASFVSEEAWDLKRHLQCSWPQSSAYSIEYEERKCCTDKRKRHHQQRKKILSQIW